MKKIIYSIIISALALTGLNSCDQDIDVPEVIEVYSGLFIKGSATPFTGLDNNGAMVPGDAVGKGAKFVKLTSGDIEFTWEDLSTKDKINTINFGVDDSDKFVVDGNAYSFTKEEGDYLVRVDTTAKTLWVDKINSWGLIGSATPTGWGSDTDMTLESYENGIYTYSITIDLKGGSHMKFRANDNWNINIGTGGVGGTLRIGGGGNDIPVDSDGNYTVKLILGSRLTYSIEKN